MYEITLLNKKGERFTKRFESEFLFSKFLNKVKHSKTLKLLSYNKI